MGRRGRKGECLPVGGFFRQAQLPAEFADDQRTSIRQWAIQRAQRGNSLRADENDWRLDYDTDTVLWIASIMLAYKLSPLEVIETERAYPGLLDAIDTVLWQDELMSEQLKAKK